MKRILSGKGDHTTTVGSNDTFTTQCEYESVVDGWKAGLDGWKASTMGISSDKGDHATSVGSTIMMLTGEVATVDSVGEIVPKGRNETKYKSKKTT